jgi:hypothetical protein
MKKFNHGCHRQHGQRETFEQKVRGSVREVRGGPLSFIRYCGIYRAYTVLHFLIHTLARVLLGGSEVILNLELPLTKGSSISIL